jgi:hypothetical protein
VTCLIVGAVLAAINHGDQLLRGQLDTTIAWQIGLTFLVPFVVATTSGAAAMRSRAAEDPRHVERTTVARALPERPDLTQ